MEFSFNISRVLPDEITVFNGGENCSDLGRKAELGSIIDNMGIRSAKAQGLKGPITTYSKIIQSKDQDLYILKKDNIVVGFIKTGRRRLFLWDSSGLIHEVVPVCILDFYVHESQQRRGHGKILFERVLEKEGIQPFEVAIDRPSSKFLSFLRKHYNLNSSIKQNNNYVVFKNFFSTCVHYDHGCSSNRRQSLPNRISMMTTASDTTGTYKHRKSLSPKWSYSTVENRSSFSPSLSATKTVSFNDSDDIQGTPAANTLTPITPTGNNNKTSICKPEEISWSEQVKPIPGSKHAPFLTLRSQPRQATTTFHSIFDQQNNTKTKQTDIHINNDSGRYSRYDTANHAAAAANNRASVMNYPRGIFDLTDQRKQFKKHLWKEHLH